MSKNPELTAFLQTISQPIQTDERTWKFCFALIPEIYTNYGVTKNQVLLPKNLTASGVKIKFIRTKQSIVIPFACNHQKNIEQNELLTAGTIYMPLTCKDILTEHPSMESLFIFYRQFAAYLHKLRFRFLDMEAQLLLTMDSEYNQAVILTTQLLIHTAIRHKDQLNTALMQQIYKTTQNYQNKLNRALKMPIEVISNKKGVA